MAFAVFSIVTGSCDSPARVQAEPVTTRRHQLSLTCESRQTLTDGKFPMNDAGVTTFCSQGKVLIHHAQSIPTYMFTANMSVVIARNLSLL